jgi:hypothetical protein
LNLLPNEPKEGYGDGEMALALNDRKFDRDGPDPMVGLVWNHDARVQFDDVPGGAIRSDFHERVFCGCAHMVV